MSYGGYSNSYNNQYRNGYGGRHQNTENTYKVCVTNISWDTNDDTLRYKFSEFGQVLDSIVMRDRETGRSRGFAFVTFSSKHEAENAINELNNKEFEGKNIFVNFSNTKR